jgi:glycosyltransferase involved in cell wall biosynthesis
MTIVESFNTGTPVIASNIGSLAEIVQHKNNGLLFMPDDAHDLSLKVKWAWNNEKYINLYSINARKEYEKKYTSQENFNQLMAIYNKVIFN